VIARVPDEHGARRVAFANTAQGTSGALMTRIVPAIKVSEGKFVFYETWKWLLLHCFLPALPIGSSGQLFDEFDEVTGKLTYMGHEQDYIAAALIALQEEDNKFVAAVLPRPIKYSEATEAISALIHVAPAYAAPEAGEAWEGENDAGCVPVYHGLDEKDRQRLMKDVGDAYVRAAVAMAAKAEAEEEAVGLTSTESVEIPEFKELIGIDPSVYRQINAALAAGKQHLMLYGPPGTGKTSLAQLVAGVLHDAYAMITGSADWSSQDVIGGYQPVGEGRVRFIPGVLLQNFDRPFIIDELNRCDIDKVIGPLFTVLSEQKTTLPYRTDVGEEKSPAFVILPKPKPGAEEHEFAPKPGWRIIATINSIDKAALYQMSFALTRRFGWIYVDVPSDLQNFLLALMRKWNIVGEESSPTGEMALTRIWRAVNGVRVIGPAPILDMLKTILAIEGETDFLHAPNNDQATAYLDGFYMYVLPMLDGILQNGAREIAIAVREALGLAEDSEESRALAEHLANLAV